MSMLRTHSKRRWYGVLAVIFVGKGVGARDR
jgi:hypothetical protein